MLWQDSQEASEPLNLSTNPISPVSSTSPTVSAGPAVATPSAPSDGHAYLGELSVFSNHGIGTSSTSSLGAATRCIEARALAATGAEQLPPQPRIDALASTYFKYLYHRVPIVNHSDMLSPKPSKLLQQAVCLAGSMLRHPETAQGTVQSEQYYVNAKTLFYNNHEKDPMMVLKALCLLSLWNMTAPAVITIDCSWNWLGLALRFAFQIGLHKESTYVDRFDPGGARRVAWFLYSQDKLQSVCFGRPQMMRNEDFDLRLPEDADFEENEVGRARLFALHAELCVIFGKMIPSHNHNNNHDQQDIATANSEHVISVLPKLRDWASKIPLEFQLLDDRGMMLYKRDAFEVLIWYFTCIITFFHLHGRLFHPSVSSTLSLVASSCAIRLYQEMDYRDHINYLMAINNWSMMTVSLPQLNSLAARVAPKDTTDESHELDVLMEIISHRTLKFPGAAAIVERLTSLRAQALAGVGIAEEDVGGIQPALTSGGPAGGEDGRAESFVAISRVYDFFPFPDVLTPKLDLLRTIDDGSLGEGELGDFPEWSMVDLFSIQDLDAFV